jgi:type III secretion protein L
MNNKKFFTLIYGDEVHIAPKTSIIPAEEFSTLMEASEVLHKIQEEADKYRMQIAVEQEQIKEEARQEGFEEGFKAWAEHITRLEQEIASIRKELQKTILPVALKAAKKIVGREVELSEDAVVDIVANSLKAVSQHKKIVIYVNKKEVELLEKHKQRLKGMFEQLESLSIKERDDIDRGGCVIETEGGIINARIENLWMVLERAFEVLMIKQGNKS